MFQNVQDQLVLVFVWNDVDPADHVHLVNSAAPASSTQASPAQIEGVSVYSPCLFGKGIVVHARQTSKPQTSHLLKQNFSETIKPIDNSCMLSSNPSINPVVC